jgi:hypothetical protein
MTIVSQTFHRSLIADLASLVQTLGESETSDGLTLTLQIVLTPEGESFGQGDGRSMWIVGG